MENKKVDKHFIIKMKEHQWRLFEYNMSKWIIENKYILDKEEKKKFYKCANYSIGSGVINASLIYFFCKKNNRYFTPVSRLFLTFSLGIYTSLVVNKIYRRKAYTEILTEKTTMTDKAVEIMNDILNVNNNNKLPSSVTEQKEKYSNTTDTDSNNFLENGYIQINTDFKPKGNNDAPLTQDVNESLVKEQMNELDRQNSYLLKESSDSISVSWDEIRRMNG
ncbi:conserved Plasmodium protein, unknown function [Plasmodium malariae]|uniref:Uncharacterized protein n=1 Tax=Plasmodium malariae TaxID=5858 RepID=A0A1D3TCM1_PLAMA|nr:conserved Plasmodium protein, unknown function [Plasmodium malariae]SCP02549.1 conserved Plasmodium protein, unknown function [Plasmodium malariae]